MPAAVTGGGLWRRRAPRIAAREPERRHTAPWPRAPVPFAWARQVLLGIPVGIATQALLLAEAHRGVAAALVSSPAAVVLGWVEAKAWYVAVHPRQTV